MIQHPIHMNKPEPLNAGTAKSMRSNKRKDTSPELTVRRALRDAGHPGYRLQWKIPGRPDITYPGKKIAIFVNGCFWHRCPKCNMGMPKHNSEYWTQKFRKNEERDAKNYSELKSAGWTVLVIWECEVKSDLKGSVKRITEALEKSN